MTSDRISLHLLASVAKANTCVGFDFRCFVLKTFDLSEPETPGPDTKNEAAS